MGRKYALRHSFCLAIGAVLASTSLAYAIDPNAIAGRQPDVQQVASQVNEMAEQVTRLEVQIAKLNEEVLTLREQQIQSQKELLAIRASER